MLLSSGSFIGNMFLCKMKIQNNRSGLFGAHVLSIHGVCHVNIKSNYLHSILINFIGNDYLSTYASWTYWVLCVTHRVCVWVEYENKYYFVTIPSFSCSSSGSRFSAQLAGVFKQNIRRFANSFRTRRRHTTNTQNIKTPCSAFNMSVMNLLQLR